MLTKILHVVAVLVLVKLLGFSLAASQPVKKINPKSNYYSVQHSEVEVPAGVKLGEYERSIRPFPNGWTLICDTDYSTHKKVCNVTQKIQDSRGVVFFSWSLAAAQNGQPVMIFRVPAKTNAAVYLYINESRFPLIVGLDGCTKELCVGYLPLENTLKTAINNRNVVRVEFSVGTPKKDFKIALSLKGLEEALKSI